MRYLYTLVAYLLLAPVFCAVLWFRGLRDRRYRRNFSQRFGRGEAVAEPSIWVHAVSVGEVQAAAVLVRTLYDRYPGVPLVVTTLTPTGDERARALLGDRADIRYLPLDLPGSVRRFFDRVKPRIAVIFETELWPNLYRECRRRRVPLVLASARLSPRSMGRYRRFLSLFSEVLSSQVTIAAQGESDAERFRSLGADPQRTHVTGNLKFDFAVPANVTTKGAELRQHYAAGRSVWVAGSTHGGEEAQVLEAHREVRRTHPGTILALVPRHPQRFAEMLRRQVVGDFLERPPQPHQVSVAPHAGPHEAAAVEVDEIHRLVAHEQDVVRVQVWMTHAQIVKGADAPTDGDPPQDRNAAHAQLLGERNRICQALGDQVCGIGEAPPPVASRNRGGHRQARPVQVIEQLPFFKRSRRRFAAPEVLIAQNAGDQPAAPIVPKHELLLARAYEVGGAAASGLAFHLIALEPECGVEPCGGRVAGPGRVI